MSNYTIEEEIRSLLRAIIEKPIGDTSLLELEQTARVTRTLLAAFHRLPAQQPEPPELSKNGIDTNELAPLSKGYDSPIGDDNQDQLNLAAKLLADQHFAEFDGVNVVLLSPSTTELRLVEVNDAMADFQDPVVTRLPVRLPEIPLPTVVVRISRFAYWATAAQGSLYESDVKLAEEEALARGDTSRASALASLRRGGDAYPASNPWPSDWEMPFILVGQKSSPSYYAFRRKNQAFEDVPGIFMEPVKFQQPNEN